MVSNKDDKQVIQISKELVSILDLIREKISEFTWGVDNGSYYLASKILAKRIKEIKLY